MTWNRWWRGKMPEAIWRLGRDGTVRLPARRGETAIRVERGLLLVTREGDPRDHVLAAGDEGRFPARGMVVAWALEPTDASVREVPTGGRSAARALSGPPPAPRPAPAHPGT